MDSIRGEIKNYDNRWKFNSNGKGGFLLENKLGDWTSSQTWIKEDVSGGIKIQNELTKLYLGTTEAISSGIEISSVSDSDGKRFLKNCLKKGSINH